MQSQPRTWPQGERRKGTAGQKRKERKRGRGRGKSQRGQPSARAKGRARDNIHFPVPFAKDNKEKE